MRAGPGEAPQISSGSKTPTEVGQDSGGESVQLGLHADLPVDPETSTPISIEESRARDATRLLNSLIENWQEQAVLERAERLKVGWFLLRMFALESAAALGIIVLYGAGLLHFPQWVATVFFAAVFGQVAGMVYWVVRYFFDKTPDQLLAEYIKNVLSHSSVE